MKKGPLHFLVRKNQSLFDTNVKMKDMEDVELVLNSATILDSGTASVRARPTVKHLSSSSDSFQGFAVPTPTVPLFAPAVNGTKINGSVSDDQSSNGSTISVTDPIEGEIFVPAPPFMAPPPPPEAFFLPPPEFMGDLSTLQPPPMTAPKPPKAIVTLQDNLPLSSPPPVSPVSVPQHPTYAPPLPPTEKIPKSFKNPPPKPIRISSVPNLDSPPHSPAPPPPVHTPTLSTFNPQSPAKVYSAPKTTFKGIYEEQDTRTKPLLLMEDAAAGPVVVKKDAKIPTKPPNKSVSLDVQEVKDIKPAVPKEVKEVKEIETAPEICAPPSIPPPPPPKTTQDEPIRERKLITAATLKEIAKTPKTPLQPSPQLQRVSSSEVPKVEKLEKPDTSPTLSGKYNPLIDRKLRNLKTNEPSGVREASPLALLMAAKQREKHRSGQLNENQPTSDSSFSSLVNTMPGPSLSLNTQDGQHEGPKAESVVAPPKQKQMNSVVPSSNPSPSRTLQASSPSPANPEPPKVEQNKPDVDILFLPPPPEFDDLEDIEPPPAMRPPDPPTKKAPIFTPIAVPPAPPTPPKPTPPPSAQPTPPRPTPPPLAQPTPPKATPPPPAQTTPPKPTPKPPAHQQPPPLPPLDTTVTTRPPPVQSKPKAAPTPLPTPVTANQATLLNILKKKMQEMDQKMGSDVGEAEANSDDWGLPEDHKVPVVPKVTSQQNAVVNKSATLDMRELKTKVAQKKKEPSTNNVSPLPVSNGPSRHQYGMTFTVRPGTKQPITLVSRGES